jgi:hypothetical protein
MTMPTYHSHYPGVGTTIRSATHSHGKQGRHTHTLTPRRQMMSSEGRNIPRPRSVITKARGEQG